MPVTFDCPHCTMSIAVPDGAAGGTGRCPHCLKECAVPGAASGTPRAGGGKESPAKPRGGTAPVPPTQWHVAPGRWVPFAEGCKLVKWGVLIELSGVALVFMLIAVALLGAADVMKPPGGLDSGAAFLLPIIPLILGALLIAVGRVGMVRLPWGSDGTAVLTVAAGLSWLRLVLLVLTGAFLVMVVGEPGKLQRGIYLDWVGRTFGLAMIAGLVAEVSVIPVLGVIGGELPSQALRRRVATATFVLQLLAALWVVMYVSVTYLDAIRELAPRPPAEPNARPPAGPGARPDPGTRFAGVTALVGVLFLLEAGYAYLHYSLYAAGEAAGRTDGDRVP